MKAHRNLFTLAISMLKALTQCNIQQCMNCMITSQRFVSYTQHHRYLDVFTFTLYLRTSGHIVHFRHTVTDTLVVPGCTFNKKLPEYNCTHTWYKNWERGKRRREEEWPLLKKRGGGCLLEGWAGTPRMPPSELTLPASSLLSLLRWVLWVGRPYKIILRFPFLEHQNGNLAPIVFSLERKKWYETHSCDRLIQLG